jgi:hypothetical protein
MWLCKLLPCDQAIDGWFRAKLQFILSSYAARVAGYFRKEQLLFLQMFEKFWFGVPEESR